MSQGPPRGDIHTLLKWSRMTYMYISMCVMVIIWITCASVFSKCNYICFENSTPENGGKIANQDHDFESTTAWPWRQRLGYGMVGSLQCDSQHNPIWIDRLDELTTSIDSSWHSSTHPSHNNIHPLFQQWHPKRTHRASRPANMPSKHWSICIPMGLRIVQKRLLWVATICVACFVGVNGRGVCCLIRCSWCYGWWVCLVLIYWLISIRQNLVCARKWFWSNAAAARSNQFWGVYSPLCSYSQRCLSCHVFNY